MRSEAIARAREYSKLQAEMYTTVSGVAAAKGNMENDMKIMRDSLAAKESDLEQIHAVAQSSKEMAQGTEMLIFSLNQSHMHIQRSSEHESTIPCQVLIFSSLMPLVL